MKILVKIFLIACILIVKHVQKTSHGSGINELYRIHDKNEYLLTRLRNYELEGIEKELDLTGITRRALIRTSRKYLGVPHCMGGTSKECIDCSGLLYASFREHGIQIPHNSEEQSRFGEIIVQKDKLKKGDLVFFINTYKTHRFITHAGIYLGDNEFIHTSSNNGVEINHLDNSYWKGKYIFGTRIFN